MEKSNYEWKKYLLVGAIAAFLLFSDYCISPFFAKNANLTWMAFLSWTIFSGADIRGRVKAIFGFIIGFFASNAIVLIGGTIGGIIGGLIGTFVINFIIIHFEKAKKIFLGSLPGIFYGMSMTFSQAGVGLKFWSWQMLLVTLIYGVLGLFAGWVGMIKIGRKS